jgi:hypothetical protein
MVGFSLNFTFNLPFIVITQLGRQTENISGMVYRSLWPEYPGFCNGLVGISVVVGCDSVSLDNGLPIFQDHCVV